MINITIVVTIRMKKTVTFVLVHISNVRMAIVLIKRMSAMEKMIVVIIRMN